MRQDRKSRRRSEDGIALLIAIFVLLLVSVVAIALLVSSNTETALGANYRSSSTVYYGALAGLEEARGRLLPKNHDYFGLSTPALAYGTTLPLGQAIYVLNQLPGETIVPWDSSDKYYDSEYAVEFGVSASSNSSVPSVWNNSPGGIPGPAYKWVRINAATEQSLYTDVNQDGTFNNTTPLFYDPAHLDSHLNPWPSLILPASPPTPPTTEVQALEITALAALPNGSQKFLQYVVAPVAINLNFPAALTMDGYSDSFSGPDHSSFQIDGNDTNSSCGTMPTALSQPPSTLVSPGFFPNPVAAIGVPDSPDVNNVKSGIPTSPTNETGNFTGTGSTPSVAQVTLAPNLQTVQGLNQLAQTVIQNADAVISGPATEANLPSAMSSTNPMTVAVEGDFHLGTSIPAGYGLLLVTGSFKYDTAANWYGIILVIGKGTVAETTQSAPGGSFNGAMLIAQIVDSLGNPLPGSNPPGPASFNNSPPTGSVGRGILYNRWCITAAEAPLTNKVLSFHEIPQQ